MSVDRVSDDVVQNETRAWAEQAASLRGRLRAQATAHPGPVQLVTPGSALASIIFGVSVGSMGDNISLEPLEKPTLGTVQEYETGALIAEALISRDVLQRVVRSDLRVYPEDEGALRSLEAAGLPGRYHPGVPLRLLGFDRRVAFVAVDPQATRSGGYVVRDDALVGECYSLFEEIWDRSEVPTAWIPYTDSGRGTDAQVLSLLASGLKDEAIARRLGLSGRTLRRIIAGLQRDVGATSRFQLAVLAARERPELPGSASQRR